MGKHMMNDQYKSENMVDMLNSAKAPHLLGQIGFAIILLAFAAALINALLPSPIQTIGMVQQPLIFVGIGGLLYHIGQHVHVLHKGAIHMAMMSSDKSNQDGHQTT